MRAINLLILHILILIFRFFQLIKTDQEPSFVASNQFDEPLVTKIKCHNRSATDQELSALIKRPAFYSTNPIIDNDLESKFSLFSNFKHSSYHCRFEFDPNTSHFQMKLTNFEKCGVSEMRSNDNKPYLSVSIRFAQLAGLRTKNDLNLVVICREQSKVYTRNHELDFRPGDHLTGGNTRIFANEPQQFHVKLQLYAAEHSNLVDEDSSSDDQEANQKKSTNQDNTIEVGETVRLNAVVRSGDGWNYAFLKDVIVSRRIGKKRNASSLNRAFITKELSTKDSTPDRHHYSNDDEDDEQIYGESNLNELINSNDHVQLVDENGCRNSNFQLIAPAHPYRTSKNNLDVNFEFRAFIFEQMDVKQDRLRISAKIVACQQLDDDCKPINCEDRKKRRRRWAKGHLIRIENGTNSTKLSKTTDSNQSGNLIRQLERQLEFRIKASRTEQTDTSDNYVQELENDFTSIHVFWFSLTIGLLAMSIILGCICLAGSLILNKSDRFK